jgi:hypothetical protein
MSAATERQRFLRAVAQEERERQKSSQKKIMIMLET